MELTMPMSPMPISPPSNASGEAVVLEWPVAHRAREIRVLLAHGEGLVRAGVRVLLEREADIAVSAQASNGEDVVTLAGELSPDVIVMDIGLPGLDALEATRRIRAAAEPARPYVLIVGVSSSDEDLLEAIRAGATGLLVDDTDPVDLVRGVRSVAQGHALLSPCVTRRLMDEFAARPHTNRVVPERLEELTAREREVMALVATGLSNDEIAERLVVSPATAKTHVSRAMVKLGVRDRAQLVALAYQTRLVEPRRPIVSERVAAPILLAA